MPRPTRGGGNLALVAPKKKLTASSGSRAREANAR
jgi:hypothetical protein